MTSSAGAAVSRKIQHGALGIALATILVLNMAIARELGAMTAGGEQLAEIAVFCTLVYATLPSWETLGRGAYTKIEDWRSGVGA